LAMINHAEYICAADIGLVCAKLSNLLNNLTLLPSGRSCFCFLQKELEVLI
jgi:hypothetical protein